MKEINLGLIGFGTIGAGVAKILTDNREIIQKRLGATVCLTKIADIDIETDRGIHIDKGVLTTSVDDILENPDIDIVIELIGGYDPARAFILKALNNKKHVVTANKALLAKHADEIFTLVEEKGLSIGFEASIGGAIPIIRSIREAFVANRIHTIVSTDVHYLSNVFQCCLFICQKKNW